MFVVRVLSAFKKEGVDFAIAGGWAVALHGAVRGTVDLDVVVVLSESNLKSVEVALNSIGLQSNLPLTAEEVFQFRKEFIEKRNMLAWRFANPSNPTEVVDILIMVDLRRLKKSFVRLGEQTLPVISKADLIRMKKKSGRPQDLEDINALERIKK